MGTGHIVRYFPGLDPLARDRLSQLKELYTFWNARINVISRKDIPNLYINHVLHSLSLAKIINFRADETVLDIGTGGGFPGIPLAILFPRVHFTLIDSTGKKIKVVESIAGELNLDNVMACHARAEEIKGRFHYVVSRAAFTFPRLVKISGGRLLRDNNGTGDHGIYSFKGGKLQDELGDWKDKVQIFDIGRFFSEDFFMTKKIVFLPSGEVNGS